MTTLPPESPNDPNAAGQVPPQAPQQPAYQQPQQPAYQQPQQPVADPTSNITLNYWLSVFFTWLPALIFWLIDKDKGNQRATAFHVANLNFSILRTAAGILTLVPYLGILAGIAALVLFIFHIVAAAKVANEYRSGGKTDPFIFNIPLVK